MNFLLPRVRTVFLALVIAALAAVGLATPGSAAPLTPLVAHSAQASCGDTSGYSVVALSSLPPEATDTVTLIQQGGPFPFPSHDGTEFTNWEQVLPVCASGYYLEYTVITPGAPTRGARRIITGSAGEYFYTSDHYATFSLVNINA
jgi:ribonuclease T1